jgi:hypothetical protein
MSSERAGLRRGRAIFLAAAALVGHGCADFAVAPTAVVVDIAPLEIDPSRDAADDLSILVDYTDGDGDLGEGFAEVHDCRVAGLVVVFELPPIATAEAVAQGVPIAGTLELVIADIGEVDGAATAPTACAELGVGAPQAAQAVFCVILTDAAGHRGAGDCTPPVAIVATL